jgi:hypothetical protein
MKLSSFSYRKYNKETNKPCLPAPEHAPLLSLPFESVWWEGRKDKENFGSTDDTTTATLRNHLLRGMLVT